MRNMSINLPEQKSRNIISFFWGGGGGCKEIYIYSKNPTIYEFWERPKKQYLPLSVLD